MMSQLRPPIKPSRNTGVKEKTVFNENELILRSQDGGFIEFQFEELRCKHYNNSIYNEAMKAIVATDPTENSKNKTNNDKALENELNSLTLSGLYQCCPELMDGSDFEKQLLEAGNKTVNMQFAMNELATVLDGTPTLKNLKNLDNEAARPTLQYENTINFNMVKAMQQQYIQNNNALAKNAILQNATENENDKNNNEQSDLLFDSLGCN